VVSFQKVQYGWVWWYISIIPALGKLRQEDWDFKARLGYIRDPVSKKQNKTKTQSQSNYEKHMKMISHRGTSFIFLNSAPQSHHT
jgi:hypothetical protein